LGAEESLLLDESSELDDDEDESSDPAAQNLDMVWFVFRERRCPWGEFVVPNYLGGSKHFTVGTQVFFGAIRARKRVQGLFFALTPLTSY
jgi:hypothetical protein